MEPAGCNMMPSGGAILARNAHLATVPIAALATLRIAAAHPGEWLAAPYRNDGPASVVGGGEDGTSGTGADTLCVRGGVDAARAAGLRWGVGALEMAAVAGTAGVRAAAFSGSGVMMLTAGIELAEGKS